MFSARFGFLLDLVMNKAGAFSALSYVLLQKARKQVEIISDVIQRHPFPHITPGLLGGPADRSQSSLMDPVGPPSFWQSQFWCKGHSSGRVSFVSLRKNSGRCKMQKLAAQEPDNA